MAGWIDEPGGTRARLVLVGMIIVALPLVALADVPTATAQTPSFRFTDPPGDVTSSGADYDGPGAETTDVVAVRLYESGRTLVFHLQLTDLSGLDTESPKAGFHAQYALSFLTPGNTDGYSMRASYRGPDMANGDPGWDYQIHNKATDEWPKARGAVDGTTIIWTASQTDFDVAPGDPLTQWNVQTWNAYDDRDQYGDWARTSKSYTLGEAETVAPDAPDDGPQTAIPGVSASLVVGVFGALLVAARRPRTR